MADHNPAKHFDELASTYEGLIGLMTGDIARHILYEMLLPATGASAAAAKNETASGAAMVIHDNACGTGLVTQYLQDIASRTGSYPTIHATDFVPAVVDVTRRKSATLGWKNVDASVMDSQALTFPDGLFDLSVTNFGIFFLPEPQRGADHIYRTLKPGGTAVVTSWKERRLIRPDSKPLGAPWEEEWSKEETLRSVLEKAGFEARKIQIVERRTDAVYEPFMRDVHLVAKAYGAAVKDWPDEDKERLGPEMLKILQAREDGPAEGLCHVAYIAIAKK
ncbi:hypothetical protein PV08_08559 [Exophiala spinifera]|uniref:Methyltransferase type 11 domain-containing protein n=1 Tax=Exophiala spinifera TaxID=91928 RepID=A0A0D1YE50_9EURO|nr:uncharacterized protein PV08_08559 [Exophiala spinifera]KIW13371.1 hypothetical protein PV08_08559 [Exophiala spinifera]